MSSLKVKSVIHSALVLSAFLISGCVNLKPKPDTVKIFALGPSSLQEATRLKYGDGIYVARPDLPQYLSGNQVRYRKLDGELKQISSARWAEPMEEGIARALSEFLMNAGAQVSKGYYPWPYASGNTAKLNLSVHRLGAYEDGTVQCQVSWKLIQSGKVIESGFFSLDSLTWEIGDPASVVAALNQGLEGLAEEIALAIE